MGETGIQYFYNNNQGGQLWLKLFTIILKL